MKLIGLAVLLFLSGCATSIETPIRSLRPPSSPQPLKVGVLPPRIHPDLERDNLTSDEPLVRQLLDGRGIVVTSATIAQDIGLELVSTLTQAGAYQRIFTVENEDDARRTGADALLTVTVWDYRTALLGSNKKYVWMTLTAPLLSQYWIRWRTIEARFEWEVKLTSMTDGEVLYRKRLKRAYTAPVRSASGHYFTDKMLSFLQNRAAPDFIAELFGLSRIQLPEAVAEKDRTQSMGIVQ
jgi:hypothetical protein